MATTLPTEAEKAGITWAAWARGPGCGKLLERAMASPAASSSSLRYHRMPITRPGAVIAHRISGRRGCRVIEVVMCCQLSVC